MKSVFYLMTAWVFSYKLFWEAVTAKTPQTVAQKAQVDSGLYRYMAASYVTQGLLLAIVLGIFLTGPEETPAAIRAAASLFEKCAFLLALNLLFKMPVRTLALVSILVSDVLSTILILAEAPVFAHITVGILLGLTLLRYMVRRS